MNTPSQLFGLDRATKKGKEESDSTIKINDNGLCRANPGFTWVCYQFNNGIFEVVLRVFLFFNCPFNVF